jgi:hypothetical protein
MSEIAILLAIAAVAAVIGVRLGIVVLAPRIGRLLDRAETNEADEESGDRPA